MSSTGEPPTIVEDVLREKHEALLNTCRQNRSRCCQCETLIETWDEAYPLPCLHVFCNEMCLQVNKNDGDIGEVDKYSCPICFMTVDQEKLDDWRPMGIAIFKKEIFLYCTHCTRNSNALYWCSECQDSMCQICRDGHPLLVRTSKHVVTFLEPNGSGRINPNTDKVLCKKHKNESLDYCLTCNKALCSSSRCTRFHLDHELKNTKKHLKEFRDKNRMANEKMKEFLVQANPLMDSINEEIKRILDPDINSDLLSLFRIEFKRILDFIAECEMQLRRKIKIASLSRVKVLNMRTCVIKSMKVQVSKYLEIVGDAAGLSSQEIIQGLSVLQDRLKYIEETMTNVFQDDDIHIPNEDSSDSSEEVDDKNNQKISELSMNGDKAQPLSNYLKPIQQVGGRLGYLVGAISNDEPPSLEIQGKFAHRSEYQKPPDLTMIGTTNTSKTSKKSSLTVSKKKDDVKGLKQKSKTTVLEMEPKPEKGGGRKTPAADVTPEEPRKGTRGTSGLVTHSPTSIVKRSTRSRSTTRKADTFSYGKEKPNTRRRRMQSSTFHDISGSRSARSLSLKVNSTPPNSEKSMKSSCDETTLDNSEDLTDNQSSPEKKMKKKDVHSGTDEEGDSGDKEEPIKIKKRGRKRRVKTATAATSTTADIIEAVIATNRVNSDELIPNITSTPRRSRGRPRLLKNMQDVGPPVLVPITVETPTVPTPIDIFPLVLMDHMKISVDDPNEDYCAVCLDGGDELLICCDFCPKVFHTKCHLPAMIGVPKDDWQCMFCKKIEDLPSIDIVLSKEEAWELAIKNLEVPSDLPRGKFLHACKFLSELFKLKECPALMLHFQRLVKDETAVHLNLIRTRLTLGKPEGYKNTDEMISYMEKMFAQAKHYYKGSEELKHLEIIENKFSENLLTFFPHLTAGIEETKDKDKDDVDDTIDEKVKEIEDENDETDDIVVDEKSIENEEETESSESPQSSENDNVPSPDDGLPKENI